MTIPLSASRLHLACVAVAAATLLPCIATALPLQLRWTVEASDPKPYRADIWRGETVELRAQLRQYGVDVALPPAATASMYYQTNGMGSAWWSIPGTASTNGLLSATWSPALDAGAGSYVFFLGAADATSNVIYRAHGQIRMLGSPGAKPNALEPPVRVIDFAATSYTNAPWLLTELDPAAGAALAGHTSATNPHAITPAMIGAATSQAAADAWELADKAIEDQLWWQDGHLADPSAHGVDQLLPLAGGVMTGAITLAAEGVAFHGVNVSSNFVIKAEYDGTNVNFNVYGVAR